MRLRTTGSLDVASAPQLDAELNRLCAVGFERLIVDLSGLQFMDSTGLRLLLRWDAAARKGGLSIELIPGPPAVQRVFDLTGTAKLLPFRHH